MSAENINETPNPDFVDHSIQDARWLLGSVAFICFVVFALGVVATYTTG